MNIYIAMQRREEDNIYEDPDEAIYWVSSNADVYCIIPSDHMISVSKLNSLYTILEKYSNQLKFT
jgi:hypothetical protein